jgi:5-formyltetrahydrofolate cyclo-ligase
MENHREQRRLTTEKRKLRESMQARRMAMPHAAMVSAASSVARHFSDHPILAFASSFAGYRAMRGEVDVMEIFKLMARYGKTTALPCVTPDKTLVYRRWQLGDALARHPLGMEEPLADAPLIEPEIILVPLLAFDGEGYRLGYGGGFYDRAISESRKQKQNQKFIGVAYSLQEVDEVPTDANDQPLDGILTELGVSMF